MAAQAADRSPEASNNQESRNQPREKKTLDRIFKTAPPDGPMRDTIIIEIRQVNGVPFKGSLHFKEAKYGIFEKCLAMDPSTIHGLSFAFSDYPIVKFKLKHQINIDTLKPREFFEFERAYRVNGMDKMDILQCKIKGIRANYEDQAEQTERETDPDIRWIKIEWCDYSIEEHEILAWLEQFGETISHLTEDIYPDSDSDGDPTGTGTFSIKMKLHTAIPQLLPMWGKRIRIYYRGIQKLCSRCFGNHPRKNCRSNKRRWVEYVLDFMEYYQDIPDELYGKWLKVVNEEFGEIINVDSETHIDASSANASSEERINANHDDQQTGPIMHPPNVAQLQPKPIQRKPAFVSKARPSHTINNPQERINNTQSQNTTGARDHGLTRQEEENLADYLNLGMSITEARQCFNKEVETAELRLRIRENKRSIQRGDIGGSSRTTIGNAQANSGKGRGGLSFN